MCACVYLAVWTRPTGCPALAHPQAPSLSLAFARLSHRTNVSASKLPAAMSRKKRGERERLKCMYGCMYVCMYVCCLQGEYKESNPEIDQGLFTHTHTHTHVHRLTLNTACMSSSVLAISVVLSWTLAGQYLSPSLVFNSRIFHCPSHPSFVSNCLFWWCMCVYVSENVCL